MNWPPSYTIKSHARARHVKLKASPKKGLEIVVPPRFNPKLIPDILEKNKAWIEKHFMKMQREVSAEFPTEISLCAMNQTFPLHLIQSDNKKLQLLFRPTKELVLFGDINNKLLCKKLLIRWIKIQAKNFLTQFLQKISALTGLSYRSVSFRGQETRWGSCSSDKNLSLNYKLIFLPEHLARHIIIHELCHTVHLNHSQKFWKLVGKFDENWKEHSKELRRQDKWVPGWV